MRPALWPERAAAALTALGATLGAPADRGTGGTNGWLDHSLADAPVFRPTLADLADGPQAYIDKIAARASQAGVAKIIFPAEYLRPAEGGSLPCDRIRYRDQTVGGESTWPRRAVSPGRFAELAQKKWENFVRQAEGDVGTAGGVEAEFWRVHRRRSMGGQGFSTVYGSDLELTSQDPRGHPLRGRPFHPQALPVHGPGSVLRTARQVQGGVAGVDTPFTYLGAVASSFNWHREDHDLMSASFLRGGAEKVWPMPPRARNRSYAAQY